MGVSSSGAETGGGCISVYPDTEFVMWNVHFTPLTGSHRRNQNKTLKTESKNAHKKKTDPSQDALNRGLSFLVAVPSLGCSVESLAVVGFSLSLSLSSVSFLRSDWNDGKATKFNSRETLLLPCLGSRARKGVGNGEGQGTERNSPSRGELMRRGPCVGWLVRGRRNGNIWTTRLLKERGISKDGAFWGWIWWWVGGWL